LLYIYIGQWIPTCYIARPIYIAKPIYIYNKIHTCDVLHDQNGNPEMACKTKIYIYGVATISRLLRITGLFCKRALQKRLYSAKETDNFKEPTNCSHPIAKFRRMTSCKTKMARPKWLARPKWPIFFLTAQLTTKDLVFTNLVVLYSKTKAFAGTDLVVFFRKNTKEFSFCEPYHKKSCVMGGNAGNP